MRLRQFFCGLVILLPSKFSMAAPLDVSQTPLFLSSAVAPLTMLIVGRDHKLYFEAYNDASDVDGDGAIELYFKPSIDYYGYFDSYKCYSYDTGNRYFYPVSKTTTKKCSGTWSGNFLNYLTTARLDALRKVLYGGYRNVDTTTNTVLQRTYIPQDGHSWGKEYRSAANDGYDISEYTPFTSPLLLGRHLFANTTLRNSGTGEPLLRVALNQPYRIWEWVSVERPVAGSRALNGGSGPLIVGITDYVVRVKVCDQSIGLEENCRLYSDGNYKPIGLLQSYGENDSMLFGLITGSYVNNLAGGVLRKNISSFKDEVDLNSGIFTSFNGIVSTLNKLTVTGFQTDYTYSCGWITTRNIVNGECEMWGNPVAEMMYEAVRYFAGKKTPTSLFNYSSGTDVTLGLPKPTWNDPYTDFPYCAKANMLVIADTPSYDSKNLPGSFFNSFSGDLTPSMDVSQLAQTIFTGEGFGSISAFIGQSGNINDGAPTPKTVTSFGNIRGLALEPNSEGSFYSAAVAYHAWTQDINSAQGTQNVKTYVVALSSPYPDFTFNVNGKPITIVPFAKSVAGSSINPAMGSYQPTNRIVDFYIESVTPTSAVLRINFDDVQQGADFDMDAIVKYTITVNSNNTLTVTLDSNYAAGSITQHLGYVISGTTHDGLYLEVRDLDTSLAGDVDYFLDTPAGQLPGGNWDDNVGLPLTSTRVFYPSSTPQAVTFKSPLWYAAKWGGFDDINGTGKPDTAATYDADGDGTPDNYFNVVNANNLYPQLAKAFEQIIDRSGSFSSSALSSGFVNNNTILYQAIFRTKDWSGQFLAFAIDPLTGNLLTNGAATSGAIWDAGEVIGTQNYSTGRKIITYKPSNNKGIPFRWPANSASPTNSELDLIQVANLNINPSSGLADTQGQERLDYIRGNRQQEIQNGGVMRDRSSVLGDIINSNPISVSKPNQFYPETWPTGSPENNLAYSTFKTTYATRQNVVYVGSNDGMLHAIHGNTGAELFSYVPSKVYPYLSMLTNPDYSHHYFVDGSPNIIDVFYNSQWHSVLVAGMGAGGQGIYALDVTDPTQFNESNAANMVLWEFTDASDPDLGLTVGQPSIVRLNNGVWAAIFGNGYNNTSMDGQVSGTGNGVIYVVNISDGTLIKKFDTGVGISADPLGTGRPNGITAPTVVDINGDLIADTIYAGDLFGNVWKINISDANPANWDFSFKTGTTPQPFFVAQDSNGNRQPITSQAAVARISFNQPTFQIFIGTGKYLETGDKVNLTVQSVYGLIDDGVNNLTGRSQLQAQTIVSEQNNMRIVSANTLPNNSKGWYLDLIYNNNARGERVVSNMIYVNKKIIFSTIIPTNNPCDFGGESWLMELDATSGSRLNYNVFDVNNDGKFDVNDSISYVSGGNTISVPASGMKSEVGLISAPAILNAGSKEYKYMSGTSGGVQKLTENPGAQIYDRQSWRELR